MAPGIKKGLDMLIKKRRMYFIGFVLLVVLVFSFTVSRRKILLQQYMDFGNSIAERYSAEITGDLNLFRALLTYGATSIDYRTTAGWSAEEIFDWIFLYYKHLQQVLGKGIVDPFVVYGERIIGANPWALDGTYDYSATEWYRKAVEADGEVIFTNVYTDAITGKPVLTIAQKCGESDSVIAFDVFPENMKIYDSRIELPPGSSTYICDDLGTLIYCNTNLTLPWDKIDDYVTRINDGFKNGSLTSYDSSVIDPNGRRRGVYGSRIIIDSRSIGWNVYITIPYSTILTQLNQFYLMVAFMVVPCFFILIFMTIRTIRFGTETDIANETVQVLGNQYYALYRVNFEKDTYEMIKGSDYLKKRLPKQGSYSEMLKAAGEVIEPEAFKEFCENFSCESIRNLAAKQTKDFGGDFLRKFGDEYRWVSVRILLDKSLSSHEAVLCFREVDREKNQQFQERKLLSDALASAKRSEKAKQTFFSNMSHDMRTPLNAILSLADLTLREDTITEKVRGYVEKISYSGRQLLNLVNDILDMSRMEQGKVVLNNQNINLEDCIQECVAPFRLQAEAEKKSFSVEIDLRNKTVMGDPVRINQVLNNLLSNAFKFTSDGDTVSLSVRQIDAMGRAQYQFTVQDTGIGMSEEFLPQLFEPYSRETRFSNRRISGTGLGMPIVKNLVTEMSGQIYVDSKPGKGTTFTLTIPFSVAEDEPVKKKPADGEKAFQEYQLKGRKILLAEDNVLNMEIATEILSLNGVEIVQAWNGKEAVEAFKASAPFEIDAILMDMQMPGMDGCEAAQHIRALPRPDAAEVPIIAVTANAFAEDIAATSAAGMNAHISKPIDFGTLCRTLSELTENRTDKA